MTRTPFPSSTHRKSGSHPLPCNTRPPQRWPNLALVPRPRGDSIAARAGIHVHPHVMRHAFGDHVARFAGIKNAQALLGHADVGTTQIDTGAPTLDELAAAVRGIRFAEESERAFYPWRRTPPAR
jgi:integrase